MEKNAVGDIEQIAHWVWCKPTETFTHSNFIFIANRLQIVSNMETLILFHIFPFTFGQGNYPQHFQNLHNISTTGKCKLPIGMSVAGIFFSSSKSAPPVSPAEGRKMFGPFFGWIFLPQFSFFLRDPLPKGEPPRPPILRG